tara:strand:- start:12115 stop:15123 length:3009 start_codon:yes stop_codon:yes gene_type:complete
MKNKSFFALFLALLTFSISLSSMSAYGQINEFDEHRACEITADWNASLDEEDQVIVGHSYRVNFQPPLPISVDPTNVDVSATHIDGNSQQIGTHTVLVAGGAIDIQMSNAPKFGDTIVIDVQSSEASCNRSFDVSVWNQPTLDHEITRETSWSLQSNDEAAYLEVNARGWQQRQQSILNANELGNGTIELLFENDGRSIELGLEITNAWINESWSESELLRQDFQLRGSGIIFVTLDDGLNGISVNGTVSDASYTRSLENGVVSEHLILEANGSISLNSDEDGRLDLDGEVSLLRFEVMDIAGQRVKQDLWIEAMASALIEFGSDNIDFELDEFIFRETWENSSRTQQHLRFRGDGRFDVLIEDENGVEIEVNGTIDNLHTEQINGVLVEDTLLLDGIYTGTVSGSFGSVRMISDSGKQLNSEGVEHDVLVIRNEYWFNVSGSQVTIPGQSLYSDHNLTFEYMTPNIDWESPIIRYRFVEDDGSINNEFPRDSPVILDPIPPESVPVLSSNVSRESGFVPDILVVGDEIDLVNNGRVSMSITVTNTSSINQIDGHSVNSAEWIGHYPGVGQSSGSTVNEGVLAGLIINCTREIQIEEDSNSTAIFTESQIVDRVLRPSIITAAENTPPQVVQVSYREAIWESEGGEAHIEILVEDPNTDVSNVILDLTEAGLGLVELSDSGLSGDQVIHDDIWTTKVNSDGPFFGDFNVTIYVSDIWVTITEQSSLELTNPGPRVSDLQRSANRLFRGDQFSIGVSAFDQHGISEIFVDLRNYGGEKVNLQPEGGSWTATTMMPYGVRPGEITFNVILVDNFGARTIHKESPNGELSFVILNEPPSMTPISLSKYDEKSTNFIMTESIILSANESPAAHIIEVGVDDPDGVSVVQAKIGRLAPIGSSEKWLSLNDDGENGDRNAGDGIYTIIFEARSSLGPGLIDIQIRSFDIYQSMTPLSEQSHQLAIEQDNSVSGNSWFNGNMQIIAILSTAFVAIAGMGVLIRVFMSDE